MSNRQDAIGITGIEPVHTAYKAAALPLSYMPIKKRQPQPSLNHKSVTSFINFLTNAIRINTIKYVIYMIILNTDL